MRPDGSGLRKLTVGWNEELSFSPGGEFVATLRTSFGRGGERREDLFVARGDGSERRRVPLPPGTFGPAAVSPDGTRLAVYYAPDDTWSDLATVSTTGGDLERLTWLREVGDAAWAPDGPQIAFVNWLRLSDGSYADQRDIYVIRADGSDLRRVGRGDRPAWSPDGNRIAFADGERQIVTVDPDGARREVVSRNGRLPAWSPDGPRLAFLRDRPCGHVGCSRIVIVDAQGGHARRVGPELAEAGVLEWTAADLPSRLDD